MISLILKMMMKIKINNPRRIQHPARVIFYFHFDLHPTYFKIDAIRKICGKKFNYNLKIKLSVPLIETCSTPTPLVTFKVEVLP